MKIKTAIQKVIISTLLLTQIACNNTSYEQQVSQVIS